MKSPLPQDDDHVKAESSAATHSSWVQEFIKSKQRSNRRSKRIESLNRRSNKSKHSVSQLTIKFIKSLKKRQDSPRSSSHYILEGNRCFESSLTPTRHVFEVIVSQKLGSNTTPRVLRVESIKEFNSTSDKAARVHRVIESQKKQFPGAINLFWYSYSL